MKTELDTQKQTQTKHGEEKLSGTFFAVMLLGTFMVVSWFGVYGLFLSR
ncbi:cytochrome c oxidase subunit 2A [Pueribacillus sp. YX66]